MTNTQSRPWLLLIPLAALPALIPLCLIFKFGVNVPYQDEWNPGLGDLLVKFHNGTLGLGDLVAQQNEHRIVLPRIAILTLGTLSHWNLIVQMVFGWVFVCFTSAGTFFLILRTAPMRRVIWLWFICNILLFSPAAWEIWLWGIGMQFFMPSMFLVGALVATQLNLSPWVRGSGCFDVYVRDFSNGNGLLAWPLVGMVWLWPIEELKARRWILLAGAGVFLLNIGLYALHYHKPPAATSLAIQTVVPEAAEPGGIVHKIEYTLAFLGAPLATKNGLAGTSLAIGIGSVMLALYIGAIGYFIWRRDVDLGQRLLPWIAIGGFALLSGAVAAIFREHLPVLQALSSRYAAFSVLFPVALINLTAIISSDLNRFSISSSVVGGAIIVFQLLGLGVSVDSARHERQVRMQWKSGVLLAKMFHENFILRAAAGPDLARLVRYINEVNEIGYLHPSLIATTDLNEIKQTIVAPQTIGKMEAFGAQAGATNRLMGTGWAMSPDLTEPAHLVLLTNENAKGQQVIISMTDQIGQRDDIARNKGIAYIQSGWAASFPIADLPPGLKLIKIRAWVLDTDTGRVFQLEGEFTLQRN